MHKYNNKMRANNTKQKRINYFNYFNFFPDNRDFFFLDSYEKIKDFNTTNFEDPEYISIISENKERKIIENIYRRNDFLNDYEFIKVTEDKSKIELNFIISKSRINIGGSGTRLITEIKLRPSLMKEIFTRSKINFNTQNLIYLKELFTIPTELKFYNRIFILHFQELNSINSINDNIQINNNGNNNLFNNNFNHFINNNQNNINYSNNYNIYNYNNNINDNDNPIMDNNANIYVNKEDPKGHTGFL